MHILCYVSVMRQDLACRREWDALQTIFMMMMMMMIIIIITIIITIISISSFKPGEDEINVPMALKPVFKQSRE